MPVARWSLADAHAPVAQWSHAANRHPQPRTARPGPALARANCQTSAVQKLRRERRELNRQMQSERLLQLSEKDSAVSMNIVTPTRISLGGGGTKCLTHRRCLFILFKFKRLRFFSFPGSEPFGPLTEKNVGQIKI